MDFAWCVPINEMDKMKKFNLPKYAFWLAVCFLVSHQVLAQDLGSSNKLFKTSPSKSASKPAVPGKSPAKTVKPAAAKKPAPKPKPVAARKNTAVSAKPTTDNPGSKSEAAPKRTASAPLKKDIVITVGQSAAKAENFDALFEQAIIEGNDARDEREYNKAEAAYLRAQSVKNSDARAIYGLGNIYSDQQRWEEAERAYQTAIQLEPTAPESYIALSFVLTQPIIGMDLSDRYAEAERLARQAIKFDPRNALAYDQLGVALELQGKIADETKNAYKKAISLDSSFALAYAHLGRLQRRNGLNSESDKSYSNAIRLATDVPTMILVADVMQSQQRYSESEQLLRRALQDDSKNPTALYLLGRALTIRESFDEAEKLLKKSAEVSPNSFTSYALLGSLFTRRGKFGDAEKYLMKALSLVSTNEKRRLAREFEAVGDGYMQNGKSKDAVRAFRQAAALDKENAAVNEKLSKAQSN